LSFLARNEVFLGVDVLILARYLSRQIWVPTLGITSLIIFATLTTRLNVWLSDALSGQGGTVELLFITFYYIPLFLQEALPAGMLLGILIGYGRLYAELEMVAMFACGMKYRQLIAATMIPAALFMGVLWVNNVWISPWSQAKASEAWARQAAVSPIDMLHAGQFTPLGEQGAVLYASEVDTENDVLTDVFLSSGLDNIYRSKTGAIWTDPESGARYLVLEQGTVQKGLPGQDGFSISTFERYGVKIQERQSKPVGKAAAISTATLVKSDATWAQSQLWWRLLSPFNLIVVVVLAVPLSKVSPRQGRFLKIFPALIIYSLYIFAQNAWVRQVGSGSIPLWAGLHVQQLLMVVLSIAAWKLPSWWQRVTS